MHISNSHKYKLYLNGATIFVKYFISKNVTKGQAIYSYSLSVSPFTTHIKILLGIAVDMQQMLICQAVCVLLSISTTELVIAHLLKQNVYIFNNLYVFGENSAVLLYFIYTFMSPKVFTILYDLH